MNIPFGHRIVQTQETRNSKLVGILFAHPNTSLAKTEIIVHLSLFYYRSGEAVDFFCIGFGAHWPPEYNADQSPVITIDGVEWMFSDSAFSKVVDELEEQTQWQYSGETELILVSAVKDASGQTHLDYSTAIVCNLEAMAADKAFTSVRAFFEGIFRFAKVNSSNDPAWALSDQQGGKVAASALRDAIFSLLPKNLKESYNKAKYYAVKNIS